MSQARPALSRVEALKEEYSGGHIPDDAFEWTVEALLQLGIADDPCPYTLTNGFEWHRDVPFPSHLILPGNEFPTS